MNDRMRSTIAAIGVAVLATGCGSGVIGESHSETPTPAQSGQPVAAQAIESLIIPVEQVPPGVHANYTENQPPPVDAGSLDACEPDYASAGHVAPIAFRSVHYTGSSNIAIVQAIEIYANPADADAVFGHLRDQLNSCKSKGTAVTVDAVSSTAATWHERGFSPSKGSQETVYATDARTSKNVVFSATAVHFSDEPQESQQAAASVADQIAAKINNTL